MRLRDPELTTHKAELLEQIQRELKEFRRTRIVGDVLFFAFLATATFTIGAPLIKETQNNSLEFTLAIFFAAAVSLWISATCDDLAAQKLSEIEQEVPWQLNHEQLSEFQPYFMFDIDVRAHQIERDVAEILEETHLT